MTIRDIPALKQDSRAALDRCGGQKKLALIYGGGLVGMSLLLTLSDHILSRMIAETGGLSNMGTRTILSTLQTMLPIVQMLVQLGWNAGYAMAILKIVRREPADHTHLTSGFSLFFPMLRAMVLEGLIYLNILILSFFLSMQIYMLTPWFQDLVTVLEPVLPSILDGSMPILDEATLIAAMDAMVPMMILFCVLSLALFIPINYRLRFSTLCLIDAPRAGALRAMATSRRILRRNCFRLFRLDLSFWWYHGILALASLIQMLPMLGLLLPQGSDFTYYLCYGVYLAILFLVFAFLHNRVECTYAAAYETLREKPQENSVVLGNIFDMQ